MKNDLLNLKRPHKIDNEKTIRNFVEKFSDYDAKRQQNVKSLIYHMKRCAKYTEDTLYFEDSVSSDYPSFSNSLNSQPILKFLFSFLCLLLRRPNIYLSRAG